MSISETRILARCQVVEEHVRLENLHDLDGVMRTFGTAARYDDEPNGERHIGRGQVRAYYADLFSAMPDLNIDVGERHATEMAVVLEVVISGHHQKRLYRCDDRAHPGGTAQQLSSVILKPKAPLTKNCPLHGPTIP